ncbi:hypothetical protein [Streptomyces californicus]|uniref:hypothetical protein n=1 Tax=Streptomyces californicus TaxID=67351 RepID=UPI00369A894A
MSTSDQDQEQHRDQPRDRREGGPDDERTEQDLGTGTLIAEPSPTGGAESASGAKADTAREAAGEAAREAVSEPAEADEAGADAEARTAEPVGARGRGDLVGATADRNRGGSAEEALPEGGRGPDDSVAEGGKVGAVVPKGADNPATPERADDAATPEGTDEADDAGEADDRDGKRLTPRQARRLRILLSTAGMVVMAVVLALRIASRSSVLVVGVYGLALILCGGMIELSRNGRTRLASWLLAAGLLAAVGTDWLLLP